MALQEPEVVHSILGALDAAIVVLQVAAAPDLPRQLVRYIFTLLNCWKCVTS